MLRIVYRNMIFDDADADIISAQGSMHQSLIADALSVDECTLTVRVHPAEMGYFVNDPSHGSGYLYTSLHEIVQVKTNDQSVIDENIAPFEAGFVNAQPVDLYENGIFFRRFYVTETLPIRINRDGTVLVQLKAVSFIGLTVFMSHDGGIYENSTVGAVLAEILGGVKNTSQSTQMLYWYDMPDGLHYTVDSQVANTRADGHLPPTNRYRSARDNIRDVCFAYGVSVMQMVDGSVQFTFNQPSGIFRVSDEDIYAGDAYNRRQTVTHVRVIANTYRRYAGEDRTTLWESANVVSHAKIVFDVPCWGLSSSQIGGVDTVQIEESGPNYAIISGTGTLYGIPYLHTQEEFSQQIGSGAQNIRTGDCGMVTLLNYQNVLERMANYYSKAKEVSASIIFRDGGVGTGRLISFTDPLGRTKEGYINELAFTASSFIKADCKITTDWRPTAVGNNFSESQVLTGSGTWRKSDAEAQAGHPLTVVRFDLIGGGNGGAAGANGSAGQLNSPGQGGAAGQGGLSGKVFSITFEAPNIPDTVTFYCGAGGAPGAEGGATRIIVSGTTYTSANGSRTPAGYMDIITGAVRAENGPEGIRGGDGGDNITGVGHSVTYKDRVWNGGAYGGGRITTRYGMRQQSGGGWRINYNDMTEIRALGGTSGGAAFGANSADASPGSDGTTWRSGSYYPYRLNGISNGDPIGSYLPKTGNGSKGADALPIDDYTPGLGSGGAGGNGGGGGGQSFSVSGAGGWRYTPGASQLYTPFTSTQESGTPGAAGRGSQGTAGGAGFVTVYF